MGISGLDDKLSTYQNSTVSPADTIQKNTTNQNVSQPEIQPNTNTNTIKTQDSISLQVQQNSSTINPTQNNSTIQLVQNNPMWNNIILGLSVIAAAIMGGVIIFIKIYKNKINVR